MTINGKEYFVRDLMRPAVIIKDDMQLRQVLEALIAGKSNIGVVVNNDGVFVGGVSTLDIIRAILPHYLRDDKIVANFVDDQLLNEDTKKAATKPVCDFVNKNDATVDPDANLLEATLLSVSDSLGRLIVVDANKKPLGILTRTEIKQVLAQFLDIENDLENICKKNSC